MWNSAWRYWNVSKDKRLGRGLEALLGRVASVNEEAQINLLDSAERELHSEPDWMIQEAFRSQTPEKLDITLIDRNPYQPREEFDEADLENLAQSLLKHGLVQPIVVRNTGERYQIVAGERRLRAAIRAGWSEVPVHILSVDDREMAELALTENIQRKDLNAMEKATAFARYLEIYGGTHEELASRLELERPTVSNLLRLLELPEQIQLAIRKSEITQGHARALLPLEEWEQLELTARIQEEAWSVRQTERFVKELLESETEKTKGWNVIGRDGTSSPAVSDKSNAYMDSLEQEFRNLLGAKVKLAHKNGKGKIVIPFTSHEEFERLFQMICRTSGKKSA